MCQIYSLALSPRVVPERPSRIAWAPPEHFPGQGVRSSIVSRGHQRASALWVVPVASRFFSLRPHPLGAASDALCLPQAHAQSPGTHGPRYLMALGPARWLCGCNSPNMNPLHLRPCAILSMRRRTQRVVSCCPETVDHLRAGNQQNPVPSRGLQPHLH